MQCVAHRGVRACLEACSYMFCMASYSETRRVCTFSDANTGAPTASLSRRASRVATRAARPRSFFGTCAQHAFTHRRTTHQMMSAPQPAPFAVANQLLRALLVRAPCVPPSLYNVP